MFGLGSSATPAPDRRTRKRDAKRDALLETASDLIERDGVTGFTMASLAEASDYAPASLYTYFASRSALFAELQTRALVTLQEVAAAHAAMWHDELGSDDAHPAPVQAAAAVLAYADLFLTAPSHHPREFRLQQELLVATGVEDAADAETVIPAALATLAVPSGLLGTAVAAGAIGAGGSDDPIAEAFGVDLARTFALVVTLNGALLADSLIAGQPATGLQLGRSITRTLLIGWGADEATVAAARVVADHLASLDGSSVAAVLGR